MCRGVAEASVETVEDADVNRPKFCRLFKRFLWLMPNGDFGHWPGLVRSVEILSNVRKYVLLIIKKTCFAFIMASETGISFT